MVIENRDAVVVGTKLTATYKKQQYVCTIEAGEDGKLVFVYDGKSYGSPSSAGTAVIGTACNGWRFWSIDGQTEAPGQPANAKTKAQTVAMPKQARRKRRQEKATAPILNRHDNQDDLADGQVRWLCSACLKNFIVEGDTTPDACPEGHSNNDPELTSPATTDEAE